MSQWLALRDTFPQWWAGEWLPLPCVAYLEETAVTDVQAWLTRRTKATHAKDKPKTRFTHAGLLLHDSSLSPVAYRFLKRIRRFEAWAERTRLVDDDEVQPQAIERQERVAILFGDAVPPAEQDLVDERTFFDASVKQAIHDELVAVTGGGMPRPEDFAIHPALERAWRNEIKRNVSQ